jgi:hypothetical protein
MSKEVEGRLSRKKADKIAPNLKESLATRRILPWMAIESRDNGETQSHARGSLLLIQNNSAREI